MSTVERSTGYTRPQPTRVEAWYAPGQSFADFSGRQVPFEGISYELGCRYDENTGSVIHRPGPTGSHQCDGHSCGGQYANRTLHVLTCGHTVLGGLACSTDCMNPLSIKGEDQIRGPPTGCEYCGRPRLFEQEVLIKVHQFFLERHTASNQYDQRRHTEMFDQSLNDELEYFSPLFEDDPEMERSYNAGGLQDVYDLYTDRLLAILDPPLAATSEPAPTLMPFDDTVYELDDSTASDERPVSIPAHWQAVRDLIVDPDEVFAADELRRAFESAMRDHSFRIRLDEVYHHTSGRRAQLNAFIQLLNPIFDSVYYEFHPTAAMVAQDDAENEAETLDDVRLELHRNMQCAVEYYERTLGIAPLTWDDICDLDGDDVYRLCTTLPQISSTWAERAFLVLRNLPADARFPRQYGRGTQDALGVILEHERHFGTLTADWNFEQAMACCDVLSGDDPDDTPWCERGQEAERATATATATAMGFADTALESLGLGFMHMLPWVGFPGLLAI